MSLVLIYVIAAVAVGMFASIRRNRNGFGWFVLSLFISPIITFVFCAILREIDESDPRRLARLNADLHDRTDAADAAAHWQLRR